MKNLFSAENYPTATPENITVGSRSAWKRPDITSVYPTDEYTLVYRLNQMADPFRDEEITASKVSSAHVVEIASTSTADYAVGEYQWQAVVVRDSDDEEITVDTGFLEVLPGNGDNPGSQDAWVYEALVNVRAVIKGTASDKQAAYSVGGRSLSLRTPQELIELERELVKRWKAVKADVNRKNGRSSGGRVLIRLGA